jgi:hypothetical protein
MTHPVCKPLVRGPTTTFSLRRRGCAQRTIADREPIEPGGPVGDKGKSGLLYPSLHQAARPRELPRPSSYYDPDSAALPPIELIDEPG